MEKIRLAVTLRNEWLAVGLSAEPADRLSAESAVTKLYAMAGAPPPAFEWVPSPLAALYAVQAARSRYPAVETRRLLTDQPWREASVAARLASLGSSLRSRFDARIRRAAVAWPGSWGQNTGTISMYGPEDAVLSGISDRSVVVVTAGQPLHGTLTDAVAAPLRAALAQAIGKAANDDQCLRSSTSSTSGAPGQRLAKARHWSLNRGQDRCPRRLRSAPAAYRARQNSITRPARGVDNGLGRGRAVWW